MTTSTEQFRAARDFLLEHRSDYERAYADFRWPRPEYFNFAIDWFDAVLCAERPDQVALRIVEDDASVADYTFAQMSARSSQVAAWLRANGVRRGTRVLALLGNQVELWEVTLAVMKLGAVLIPATTQLTALDLEDRVTRAHAGAMIARSDITERFSDVPESLIRICVGAHKEGWLTYAEHAEELEAFSPDAATAASDPLLIYFTSGTTALPKMVEHAQVSYPIGHLSTMYWIGLRPGDVHLNVSSPGWAKHAWSCVFAPWIAGATICIFNYTRLEDHDLLCATHRVAPADPRGPRQVAAVASGAR